MKEVEELPLCIRKRKKEDKNFGKLHQTLVRLGQY